MLIHLFYHECETNIFSINGTMVVSLGDMKLQCPNWMKLRLECSVMGPATVQPKSVLTADGPQQLKEYIPAVSVPLGNLHLSVSQLEYYYLPSFYFLSHLSLCFLSFKLHRYINRAHVWDSAFPTQHNLQHTL